MPDFLFSDDELDEAPMEMGEASVVEAAVPAISFSDCSDSDHEPAEAPMEGVPPPELSASAPPPGC